MYIHRVFPLFSVAKSMELFSVNTLKKSGIESVMAVGLLLRNQSCPGDDENVPEEAHPKQVLFHVPMKQLLPQYY